MRASAPNGADSPASEGKAPRTARGERTLRKILDAALDEFGERGFSEGSIVGITQRADVALGTFYTYFDSKEDVFRALAVYLPPEEGAPPQPLPEACANTTIRSNSPATMSVASAYHNESRLRESPPVRTPSAAASRAPGSARGETVQRRGVVVACRGASRSRGGKVSFTHLIGFALVRALRRMPEMNCSHDQVEGKPAPMPPPRIGLG